MSCFPYKYSASHARGGRPSIAPQQHLSCWQRAIRMNALAAPCFICIVALWVAILGWWWMRSRFGTEGQQGSEQRGNSISRGGMALDGQSSASELRLAGPVAREACRLGMAARFVEEVRDGLPFLPALQGFVSGD